MKKIIKMVISAILVLTVAVLPTFTGCAPSENQETDTKESVENSTFEDTEKETPEDTQVNTETEKETETETEKPTETETEPEPTPIVNNFEVYQSNTSCATGHNYMLWGADNHKDVVTNTYRGVFRAQETGKFDYKLHFANCIDSCSHAYSTTVGMPVKPYKIISAYIFSSTHQAGLKQTTEKIPVTFDGKVSKDVAPNETFWSDTVEVDVKPNDEGEGYIVFEWTIEYVCIPATITASTFYAYKSSKFPNGMSRFAIDYYSPMPDLIGCNRKDNIRVGFIGDSITEGTAAGSFRYEFWVSQIADRVGKGYSIWNLGLDSARARDAVKAKHWLEKAKNTDVLCICLGINDIVNGTDEGSRSAKQIFSDIKFIAETCNEAGADIVLFSIPPFTGANAKKWNDTNDMIKEYAKEKGFKFFDFAAVLAKPEAPLKPIYGDHPNAQGCIAVAEAFVKANILEYRD